MKEKQKKYQVWTQEGGNIIELLKEKENPKGRKVQKELEMEDIL